MSSLFYSLNKRASYNGIRAALRKAASYGIRKYALSGYGVPQFPNETDIEETKQPQDHDPAVYHPGFTVSPMTSQNIGEAYSSGVINKDETAATFDVAKQNPKAGNVVLNTYSALTNVQEQAERSGDTKTAQKAQEARAALTNAAISGDVNNTVTVASNISIDFGGYTPAMPDYGNTGSAAPAKSGINWKDIGYGAGAAALGGGAGYLLAKLIRGKKLTTGGAIGATALGALLGGGGAYAGAKYLKGRNA